MATVKATGFIASYSSHSESSGPHGSYSSDRVDTTSFAINDSVACGGTACPTSDSTMLRFASTAIAYRMSSSTTITLECDPAHKAFKTISYSYSYDMSEGLTGNNSSRSESRSIYLHDIAWAEGSDGSLTAVISGDEIMDHFGGIYSRSLSRSFQQNVGSSSNSYNLQRFIGLSPDARIEITVR
jgi:hypothetical protein